MLQLFFVMSVASSAAPAQVYLDHYPRLWALTEGPRTLEFTLERESRARALYRRRYGHFASLDRREWDSIHPDFRELVAREEAMDDELDRRVADASYVSTASVQSLGSRTRIDELIDLLRLRLSLADAFRDHLVARAETMPSLNLADLNATLELDAEMLARTFERMVDAPHPRVIEIRRAQALQILMHAYLFASRGPTRTWPHRVLSRVIDLDSSAVHRRRFWMTVRASLRATAEGTRAVDYDARDTAIDADPRPTDDPGVIAERVVAKLGGIFFVPHCEDLLKATPPQLN